MAKAGRKAAKAAKARSSRCTTCSSATRWISRAPIEAAGAPSCGAAVRARDSAGVPVGATGRVHQAPPPRPARPDQPPALSLAARLRTWPMNCCASGLSSRVRSDTAATLVAGPGSS